MCMRVVGVGRKHGELGSTTRVKIKMFFAALIKADMVFL